MLFISILFYRVLPLFYRDKYWIKTEEENNFNTLSTTFTYVITNKTRMLSWKFKKTNIWINSRNLLKSFHSVSIFYIWQTVVYKLVLQLVFRIMIYLSLIFYVINCCMLPQVSHMHILIQSRMKVYYYSLDALNNVVLCCILLVSCDSFNII